MDCGFGADNQLVMKDSFGRVIKNKSTNKRPKKDHSKILGL